MLLKSLISLASATLVSAHFTLDSPATRGFDEDVEQNASCGGYPDPSSNRTTFPLTGGKYQIDSHHAQANVQVVFSPDGRTFGQQAIESYTITGLGTMCVGIPAGALSRYSAGDNVTMQIIYKASSEGSPLYQCADLTLTSGSGTSGTCVNGTGVSLSQVTLAPGVSAAASVSASRVGSSASQARTSGAATSSARAASGASTRAGWRVADIFVGVAVLISIGAFAL